MCVWIGRFWMKEWGSQRNVEAEGHKNVNKQESIADVQHVHFSDYLCLSMIFPRIFNSIQSFEGNDWVGSCQLPMNWLRNLWELTPRKQNLSGTDPQRYKIDTYSSAWVQESLGIMASLRIGISRNFYLYLTTDCLLYKVLLFIILRVHGLPV